MVAGLFPGAGTLPGQLDQVIAELRATRDAVQSIAAGQSSQPADAEVLVIPLSSASLPNAWYATSDQLRVIALDFYTDTAARYALTVEGDTSIWFRAAVNARTPVVDGPRRLVIPRGVRIGFTTSGSAPFTTAGVWDAIIWAYAGDVPGRQDKG